MLTIKDVESLWKVKNLFSARLLNRGLIQFHILNIKCHTKHWKPIFFYKVNVCQSITAPFNSKWSTRINLCSGFVVPTINSSFTAIVCLGMKLFLIKTLSISFNQMRLRWFQANIYSGLRHLFNCPKTRLQKPCIKHSSCVHFPKLSNDLCFLCKQDKAEKLQEQFRSAASKEVLSRIFSVVWKNLFKGEGLYWYWESLKTEKIAKIKFVMNEVSVEHTHLLLVVFYPSWYKKCYKHKLLFICLILFTSSFDFERTRQSCE